MAGFREYATHSRTLVLSIKQEFQLYIWALGRSCFHVSGNLASIRGLNVPTRSLYTVIAFGLGTSGTLTSVTRSSPLHEALCKQPLSSHVKILPPVIEIGVIDDDPLL